MKKREELKIEFQSLGKNINPLMLIQLPNDDKQLVERDEQKKEPEPQLKEEYKNNLNHRLGYLYTNYKHTEIEIPDEGLQNKPLVKIARIRKGIKNIELPSDYLSRLDYGDIRDSAKFQELFK